LTSPPPKCAPPSKPVLSVPASSWCAKARSTFARPNRLHRSTSATEWRAGQENRGPGLMAEAEQGVLSGSGKQAGAQEQGPHGGAGGARRGPRHGRAASFRKPRAVVG